jgi:hypothetical protein
VLFLNKAQSIGRDDIPVLISALNPDSFAHRASKYEALLEAQWIVGA